MEELEQILRAHALRYPEMEPTDAVKLIYQNEFGGGHLIRDEEAALEYLRREYAGAEHKTPAVCPEDIGNGIARVHLSGLSPEALEALGRCFARSAAAHRGQMDRFLSKLALLRSVTFAGGMPFSLEALDAYLARYREAGYPMVSHSDGYRRAYRPAYRIVLKNFWQNA